MDEESADAHVSYWERWTDDRGPFYRSCAVIPFDSVSEPNNGERPEITFSTGVPRLMLRNLPTLLLAVLVVWTPTTLAAQLTAGRLSLAVPRPGLETVALLLPAVAIGGLWIYLLYRLLTGTLDSTGVHRSLVFFATLVPLAAGTAYTVYEAWANPGTAPAVTVQAGYFLFVLVAGHLVYDGLVLRTENLLAELGDSEIVDRAAYATFREERLSRMGATVDVGPITVSRSVAFTAALSFVPLALPYLTLGWNVWTMIAFVPYSVVTVLIVAVAYDAFVLIYTFMELLRRDILVYKPFHPDDHGGFRDLGRFATRLNVVLAVTGGYVAYRFVVEGLYYFSAQASPLEMVTWIVSYVGPVVAYVCFTLFWLYHSFWKLHRKMEEGRRKQVELLQRRERDRHDDPDGRTEAFADLNVDAPAWESLQGAPTWPIKRQSLFGIVVLDSVPVLATFVL
ncbi:hypothetical protein [Halorientalis halophila]|uniref:hypothetical protein n=1 Tax=Halorientalis halophila TaxID=3108499 RepID=UPI0030086ECB